MPTFVINTNVLESTVADPKALLADVSSTVAELLGKPEQYVCVHINWAQTMTFGASAEPCAYMSLHSIGKIGPTENKKFSKEMMELLNKQLHIDTDRMYIIFTDLEKPNVGWKGSTF